MGCICSSPAPPFDGPALLRRFARGERRLHALLGVDAASLAEGVGAGVEAGRLADYYVISHRSALTGYKVFVAFFDAGNRMLPTREVLAGGARGATGAGGASGDLVVGASVAAVRRAGLVPRDACRDGGEPQSYDLFAVLVDRAA